MQKVLVVDDSLSVRKLVEKALEGRGLQVLAAASGAEAILMIDRDRPDVVICDVILPDKDGYQICQYVRTHPAIGATPVLLISGIDNGTVQAPAGTPGIRFVVLTDREGFLIETAGDLAPDADEVAGALASCLAEASDGIGRELGQGRLTGTILEYESGTLLLHGVGPSALLAVLVGDQGALGKVRYYLRKAVPELV